MEQTTTTRWLLALNLLVIVALVAALISVTSGNGITPPSIDADALAGADTEAESPSSGAPELEGDLFAAEVKTYRGSDFTHLGDGSGELDYFGEGCVHANGSGNLRLQIDLPDDAEVSSITVYVDDFDAASNISATSNYTEPAASSPGLNTWFTSDSSTGSSGAESLSLGAPNTSGDEVIDKVTRNYELRISGTDNDERVCGAQITFFIEDSSQLTFHAVEPCAVFDTRTGQGGREAPLDPLETVSFDAVLSNYSSQGGFAGSCGVPDEIGGFLDSGEGTVAVMVNLVALNATGNGNLKIWDDDDSEPAGGVLVYSSSANSNVILPIGVRDDTFGLPGTDGGDVNVKNNSGSSAVDVRAVVVGYYTKPLVNQE